MVFSLTKKNLFLLVWLLVWPIVILQFRPLLNNSLSQNVDFPNEIISKHNIEFSPSEANKLRFRNWDGNPVTCFNNLPMEANFHHLVIHTKYILDGEEKKLEMYAMGTKSNPPFVAVIGNPQEEAASSEIWSTGDMELPTRKMFEYIIRDACLSGDHLVVDAGANIGYLTTYSLAAGCRVAAIEPQVRLLPLIETAAAMNGKRQKLKLFNNIVNTDPTARLQITYAQGSCTGCSVVKPVPPGATPAKNSYIVDAVRIDGIIKENVILLKVDVEGYEVIALESAQKLIDSYNVENIIVEWSPLRWKNEHTHSIEKGTQMLESFYDRGYTVYHYNLRFLLPSDLPKIEIPELGPLWQIPRNRIAECHEILSSGKNYGEANLWITKKKIGI